MKDIIAGDMDITNISKTDKWQLRMEMCNKQPTFINKERNIYFKLGGVFKNSIVANIF